MIKIPIELVTLEDDSYHLLVACQINGIAGFLVVDTGASKTVLDSNFVNEYTTLSEEQKIKSHGVGEEQFATQLVEINHFEIGNPNSEEQPIITLKIDAFPCALIDLSTLNAMYQQFCNRTICGLLGSDLLLKHAAIIDYQGKILHLQPNLQSNEN